MMSCKLFMENNKWGAIAEEVSFVTSPSGPYKDIVLKKELHGKTLEEVSSFLIRHGIDNNEIDVAVQAMLTQEHNVANFGFFGGFIFSTFEGIVH